MDTIRLCRLNEIIQRVVALNFDSPIWITAELVQAKVNKGHTYLEIAERSEHEDIIAQSSAVIWKNNWNILSKKIDNTILKEGNQLRLYVLVEYHPRFGLKLNVLDIDVTYTLGEISKLKLATIERLKQESLWQNNKSTKLPLVIKKIAVITSLSSAGKKDFESQLLDNPHGYMFQLVYFPATMQGSNTPTEVSHALHLINIQLEKAFQCIVIIRGGGAKLDLIDFDQYNIAQQVSLSKIPVLTGIGHHQDESIADMNAYLSLKTPTAVAEFILQHNLNFESDLVNKFNIIASLAQSKINKSLDKLSNDKNKINYQFNQTVFREL
ncbi:MAG: exodeoxyribonuclease VII large subunit [Saprospiraceae bacterium]